MKRNLVYISGTRADFGLMRSTLMVINNSEEFDLSLIVTGMHLSNKYGLTVKEIKDVGLKIRNEVLVNVDDATNLNAANNIGSMVQGISESLYYNPPDYVILLGDRGEMLAGAISALTLTTSTGSNNLSDNGNHITIIPNITPSNATNQHITWCVDNTSYATIDSNGVLTSKNIYNVPVIVFASTSDGSGIIATIEILITT